MGLRQGEQEEWLTLDGHKFLNKALAQKLEHIIPRYGGINYVDLDTGPHFIAQTLQATIKALGMKWRLHTPWHPQSSGRAEKMNKTLKHVLTKLMAETQMNWLRCLPLALLQIRMRPRSDLGVSHMI